MNTTLGNTAGTFTRGHEYDVDDALGSSWVGAGAAEDVTPKKRTPKKAAAEDDDE